MIDYEETKSQPISRTGTVPWERWGEIPLRDPISCKPCTKFSRDFDLAQLDSMAKNVIQKFGKK